MLEQDVLAARTVIAGDLSGGGLSVATALALRDAGDPSPAGLTVLSPWADLACSGASMQTRRDVDVAATQPGLLEMAGWYLDGTDPRTPHASPVYGDFALMSPLLAVVGGEEILLDDAVRLLCATSEAGVDATLYIGGGMQHVFPIWKGVLPEADAAISLIGEWISARTG